MVVLDRAFFGCNGQRKHVVAESRVQQSTCGGGDIEDIDGFRWPTEACRRRVQSPAGYLRWRGHRGHRRFRLTPCHRSWHCQILIAPCRGMPRPHRCSPSMDTKGWKLQKLVRASLGAGRAIPIVVVQFARGFGKLVFGWICRSMAIVAGRLCRGTIPDGLRPQRAVHHQGHPDGAGHLVCERCQGARVGVE